MSRRRPSLLVPTLFAATPLALLVACTDTLAPNAKPSAAKPDAALVGGPSGPIGPIDPDNVPPVCTIASCGQQVGGGPIVATRSYNGNHDVVILAPNGLVAKRLTDHNAHESHPALSPDGTKVAFFSMRDGGGVYVIKTDGTGLTKLTSATYGKGLSWSPDGAKIVFAASINGQPGAIWLMNANGTYAKKLATGTTYSPARSPAFSPDGMSIIFAAPGTGGQGGDYELFRYSFATQITAQLTSSDDHEYDPAFTPNGQHYIYVRAKTDGSNYDVMIRPTTGNGAAQILLTGWSPKSSLSFSPDGAWFVYRRDLAGSPTPQTLWRTSFPSLSSHVQITSSNAAFDTPSWKN